MSARRIAALLALLAALSPLPASAADPVARGLAAQARAAVTAQAQLAKLQRAAAAGMTGPETADPAPGVTVSVATSQDSTLTHRYSGAALFGYARATGGRATYAPGGNAWYFPVASILPATNGNLSGALPATPDQQAWGWEVGFQTDTASRVQIRIGSGATTKAFRLLVDGRYVANPNGGAGAKDPIPFVAAGDNFITVDFAGAPAPHSLRLEAQSQVAFNSIYVAPTASIAPPAGSPDRTIVLVSGDSYEEGQGETYPGLRAWPKTLGRLMGWSDVRQVAVGGTGVLNAGTGPRSTIRGQIPRWLAVNSDLAAAQVDVVLFAPGVNDAYLLRTGAVTQAALQTEYLADLRLIRPTCPNALVVVFGSGAGSTGPDAFVLQAEAAAQAAFATWADKRALFVPISADPTPWVAGTGHIGAANGSGNGDVAIAADGVHPSDLGHQIYARRAAAAIRAYLASR